MGGKKKALDFETCLSAYLVLWIGFPGGAAGGKESIHLPMQKTQGTWV